MTRIIAAFVALVAALLIQLTIVNGLPLPGGGAPDLVLILVIAVGLVGGPRPGIVAGFLAGLILDLAPPAYQLVGLYALVFCLVGYACGRLQRTLRSSAVFAIAVAAAAAIAGEIMVAGLTWVLGSPRVPKDVVVRVLASSVLYDLALIPLVLFVTVRVAAWSGAGSYRPKDSPALERGGSAAPVGIAALQGQLVGRTQVPIGGVGWLAGPATSRRARRKRARLQAKLTGAVPRRGDAWLGRRPAGLVPATASFGATVRSGASGLSSLRPQTGVAGSASALTPPRRSLGPAVPRIAFGTGALPGAGRAAGRGVPRIAFGNGGLPGAARVARRPVPKIAFGNGGLPGSARAAQHRTPKIAFGTRSLVTAAKTTPGRPAAPRFGNGPAWSAAGPWLAAAAAPSGGNGRAHLPAGWIEARHVHRPVPGRARRSKHPNFARSTTRYPVARRQPKVARIRAGRRRVRWLPWTRRAGSRSTVWRIGSARTGGYR